MTEGSRALAQGKMRRSLEGMCLFPCNLWISFSVIKGNCPLLLILDCSLSFQIRPSWMMPGSGWGQRMGWSISTGSTGWSVGTNSSSGFTVGSTCGVLSCSVVLVSSLPFLMRLCFTASWTADDLLHVPSGKNVMAGSFERCFLRNCLKDSLMSWSYKRMSRALEEVFARNALVTAGKQGSSKSIKCGRRSSKSIKSQCAENPRVRKLHKMCASMLATIISKP